MICMVLSTADEVVDDIDMLSNCDRVWITY